MPGGTPGRNIVSAQEGAKSFSIRGSRQLAANSRFGTVLAG
jgi:hypothetical protein